MFFPGRPTKPETCANIWLCGPSGFPPGALLQYRVGYLPAQREYDIMEIICADNNQAVSNVPDIIPEGFSHHS